MEAKKADNMELYTGWFAVWFLLGCMEREFFRCGEEVTAEKLEQIRARAGEMIEHLENCKREGLLQLEDIDKGGGFSAILRGLAKIEESIPQDGGEVTEKDWLELEYIMIRIHIHAWAQRMRAYTRIKEAAQAEVIP